VAALLRGDIKSRYEAYQIGLGGAPFLTQNEVRRFESMPGVDGGDEIRNPLNMDDPGGADNEERQPADSGEDGVAQNATREAFRVQLRYWADVEAKRIRHEAADPKRFTDWLDRFYGDGQWVARLRDHLVPWGKADLAEAWCRRSQEILDLVVSTATPAELAAAIEESLAEWPARVDAAVREAFPQEAKA